LVIRPDSGDPATIVVRTLQQLDEGFGSTVNEKGYKVLAPCVRVIQGDGISSCEAIDGILQAVVNSGYSADNLTFGMGAGLAQKYDRDTLMWAMKNSAVNNGDVWTDVCKCPEDAPWKASKEGVLDVTTDFRTVNTRYEYVENSALKPLFKDGQLFTENFDTIRNRF
jgi:nicotinamide phosphoribosyltransferase